jgi:hypothetical protein
MKKIAALLLVVIPIQAMFVRTSRVVRQKPLQSAQSLRYQKSLARRTVLKTQKNEPAKQHLIPRHTITTYNKKPTFEQLHTRSNWSWGALLTTLGLGWLWYNSEDEKKAVYDLLIMVV